MINTAYCKHCKKQIAAKKCCNHVLHCILSICTGGLWIIIWILAIFADDNYRCSECGQKVKLGTTEPLQHCPSCEAIIEKDVLFCPHCGASVEKFCKKCSTRNAPDALFCKNCGEKLNN